MADEEIDVERVIHDPSYRRRVIHRLNALPVGSVQASLAPASLAPASLAPASLAPVGLVPVANEVPPASAAIPVPAGEEERSRR